jgi:endonuclease YncB( thermonuclease family)
MGQAVAQLLFASCLLAGAACAEPIEPGAIQVIDGDTIRAHGLTVRLVGFDAPETGFRAR